MPTEPRTAPDAPTRPDPPAKQIGIRIPPELSDRLEAIARRENNGISAVCRRLLTTALEAGEAGR
jgi:predicted DNA-binding protein